MCLLCLAWCPPILSGHHCLSLRLDLVEGGGRTLTCMEDFQTGFFKLLCRALEGQADNLNDIVISEFAADGSTGPSRMVKKGVWKYINRVITPTYFPCLYARLKSTKSDHKTPPLIMGSHIYINTLY